MTKTARLTLSQALASGRLDDFVAQAEADGIGPADRSQFDALMRVTAPPPEDQTSRSPDCDGSPEK